MGNRKGDWKPGAKDDSSTVEAFLPVRDALAGASHSENVRHVIARVAFMNELLRDPRVAQLFQAWGKRTHLAQAAQAVASSLDTVVAATGLDHRWQLFEKEVPRLP